MGITRTDLYTDRQNELALWAKALGHPARIAIVEHLLAKNACITGDLVQEIGLAQATISQHLRALRDAGIIRGTIEGTSVNYCIDAQRWAAFQDVFAALFNRYADGSSDGCC